MLRNKDYVLKQITSIQSMNTRKPRLLSVAILWWTWGVGKSESGGLEKVKVKTFQKTRFEFWKMSVVYSLIIMGQMNDTSRWQSSLVPTEVFKLKTKAPLCQMLY